MESSDKVQEDFAVILRVLPHGWQAMAKELGALRRCRKIPSPEVLLQLLLIHLAEGCSLRETALIGREGGLAAISDVAIMDRLRSSGAWFAWMNQQLMRRWLVQQPEAVFRGRWNLRVVDGTQIKEPGPTGSSWRIHYKISLPSLGCEEMILLPHKGAGESFKRFSVEPNDLFIGDRVYGVRPSIQHVTSQQGDVLTRFAMKNLPLLTREGRPFELLKRLRTLHGTSIGDWPVRLESKEFALDGRVCAIRKSRQAAQESRKKALRQAQKQGAQVQEETLESAEYVFVFTTLSADDLSAEDSLEMYRGRWQVELVFKRLKSIIGLGHLHKIDEESARAWLHGKMFVALLVESLLRYADSFFPWGYPLASEGDTPVHLA